MAVTSDRGVHGTRRLIYGSRCRGVHSSKGRGVARDVSDLATLAHDHRDKTRTIFANICHGVRLYTTLLMLLVLRVYVVAHRLIMGPLVSCNRDVQHKRVFPIINTTRLRSLTLACGRICHRGRRARGVVHRRTRRSTLANTLGHNSFRGVLGVCGGNRGPFTVVVYSVSVFGRIGSACKRTINSRVLGGITGLLRAAFHDISCIYHVNNSRFTIVVISIGRRLDCAVHRGVAIVGGRLCYPASSLPTISLDINITFASHTGPNRDVFGSTSGTLCHIGRGNGRNYNFCWIHASFTRLHHLPSLLFPQHYPFYKSLLKPSTLRNAIYPTYIPRRVRLRRVPTHLPRNRRSFCTIQRTTTTCCCRSVMHATILHYGQNNYF